MALKTMGKSKTGDGGIPYSRKLDSLGRVVIPQDIRSILGWESGEKISMEFYGAKNDSVILRLHEPRCSLCRHKSEDLAEVGFGQICPGCVQKIYAAKEEASSGV